MGWSCLQTQSESLKKVMAWQQTQPEYTKEKRNFVFLELLEKGDFDDNNPLILEIIEVIKGAGYRRGSLIIKGDGTILNRSYLNLPDFNE